MFFCLIRYIVLFVCIFYCRYIFNFLNGGLREGEVEEFGSVFDYDVLYCVLKGGI